MPSPSQDFALSQPAGEIRIGISGWRYKGWRGIFYPPKLQQRRELEFASGIFNTIEINGTFYSLQHHTSFQQWARDTPDDFIFSIKGSRFITHMKKLRGIDQAFANLLASGLLALGPKLGPILWQFPPQLHFDPGRFADFFRLLPRTTTAAAKLAKTCDDRMLSRSVLEASVDIPLRHTVEIRHESFATPTFIDLLRQHDIGLVVADTPEWPLLLDVTSSLVYLRLHGSEQLYASNYTDEALDIWAQRIVTWARGGTPDELAPARRIHPDLAPSQPRDVYVYFDNDAKVHAPFDAQNLRTRVDKLLAATPHQL
jgi:uncharacterized protein YecE (DUF72 family)